MIEKKNSRNTRWKADIEFVFQQLKLFYRGRPLIGHEQFLPAKQVYGSLPHPNGGWVTCGVDADLKIVEIVKEHLSKTKGRSQLEFDSVLVAFRKELSDRFIGQELRISAVQIDQAINKAVRVAKSERETITHWIPCHLVENAEPASINIGPVAFQRISKFMQDLQPEFARYINERGSDQVRSNMEGIDPDRVESKRRGEDLVDAARRYYEHFDWVAKVTISEFAPRPSAERASLCVQAALDVFRFFLGRLNGHRIDTETHGIRGIEGARIIEIGKGKLDISLSRSLTAPMLNDDGWSKLITFFNSGSANFVNNLLRTLMANDTPPPLCQRLLDALNWFGQAVTETSPGAAITKFVSSIERIVQCGKKDKDGSVTKQFCDRAAALCATTDDSNFDDWNSRLRKLYGMRSDIVHGSISPLDIAVRIEIESAERLAQRVILGAITFFEQLNVHSIEWSPKKLDKKMDSFVQEFQQTSLSTTQAEDVNK